jgi:hypothetical protein
MGKSTYEIIQAIKQAEANAYDGAKNEKGEDLKVGLKREKGDVILDTRIMDAFGLKIVGNLLMLNYSTEAKIKEIHQMGLAKYKTETESTLKSIVSYLKKEYKKITGDALTLTKHGEVDIRIDPISKIRNSIKANCSYKIGGIKEVEQSKGAKSWEDAVKDMYSTLKKESFDKSMAKDQGNKLFRNLG